MNALKTYIRRTVDIEESVLSDICSHFEATTVPKGTHLLNEGEYSKYTYFVLEGCLRIYYINNEGLESTRYLAFEHHLATALVSYINQEPSLECMQAMEDSRLLRISHERFDTLRNTYPQWDDFYRAYLEKAYSKTVSRLFSFTSMDAKNRYQQLLRISPEIVQRLPNKIVASYLGISQETLSRIKSKD